MKGQQQSSSAPTLTQLPSTLQNKKIQILIAHPDDEVMFFAPSILELAKPHHGNLLHLTCFSVGNDQGLGPVRRLELIRSLGILGIDQYDIVDDEEKFQDSMSTTWDETLINAYIASDTDVILTFDENGVSNHPNHKSLYRAALSTSDSVSVYSLKTWEVSKKYSSTLYTNYQLLIQCFWPLLSFGSTDGDQKTFQQVLIFGNLYDSLVGLTAMVTGHYSQMVWFRWFWVALSRYGNANELIRVK